jgi:asparagine synthase (glutamine-hydrolysing)
MCGIAGYVGPRNEVDARRLLDALSARGPDGEGQHRAVGPGGHVLLVHRRLAILDPTPMSAQPYVLEDGHALVFNGEIFNFRQLRAELSSEDGVVFRSQGDTEVVLHGLRLHGPAFLERLRGPFAIALWNPRGELLLARDRLGINPLYVAEVPGGGVAFSSTVTALHRAGLTRGGINVRGVCGHLFYGSVPEPLTLLEGVSELPPGTWKRVLPDGRTQQARWWRVAPEDPTPPTEEDAAERVRAALADAVQAELVSDVPLALLLSSGLDSTAVASLVARASGGAAVEAFTVGFDEDERAVDESVLAAQTAAHLGLKHRRVHVDVRDGVASLQAALAAQDLPSMDGINTFLVSRAIARAGYKVALSGLGGDELFLGYANRANFHRLARLPRVSLPGSAVVRQVMGRLGLPPRVERALHAAARPQGMRGAYAAVRTVMGPATLAGLLHPDVLAQVTEEDLDPVSYLADETLPVDVDGALSRLELGHYLRSTLLKDSNQLSLANGLELRVPMMDWQLVDAVMRVPGRLRAAGVGKKPLLTRAMRDWMPPGVEQRPKVGFVLPLQGWLRQSGMLETRGRGPRLLRDDPQSGLAFPVSLAVASLQAWALRL